jgi:hypothetical protein
MTSTSAPLFVTTETDEPPGSDAQSPPTGREARRAEKRRADLAAMVDRIVDPAIGLCLRALDRRGTDLDNSRAEAREIVVQALRPMVSKGIGDDDRTVHRCFRRTAEVALDRLIGKDIQVPLPRDVDMAELLGDVSLEAVAPQGLLSLSELQDTVASARSSDRQTAFVVMAAGLPPQDAATLLGRSEAEVRTSLRRVARRLGESHMHQSGAER